MEFGPYLFFASPEGVVGAAIIVLAAAAILARQLLALDPVRSGICAGAVIALSAPPALAEVCDKERPNWNGEPVDWVDNLFGFLFTPLGTFFVLAAAAVTILKNDKHRRAAFGVTALAGAISLWEVLAPDPVRLAAIAEGCIGGPTEIVICIAALLGLSLRTTLRGPG
ncbi:MAG: hypothetical protein AAF401_11835 [Pseudomonadota bacterium]